MTPDLRAVSKKRIRRAFDKSAPDYERYADFQNEIGEQLLRQITDSGISGNLAVDVGCGAGSVAMGLARSGGFRSTLAYDISYGMAKVTSKRWEGAPPCLFVAQADAELAPVGIGSVDLVLSNLVLQWALDLKSTVGQVALALKKGGHFFATALGASTFVELRESVTTALVKTGKPRDSSIFHRFVHEGQISAILEELRFDFTVRRKIHAKRFDDIYHLLRTMKNIGAHSSVGLSAFGLGRREIMRIAADEYNQLYPMDGGVRVTYEVLYINAQMK